jgi:hypothetical protein
MTRETNAADARRSGPPVMAAALIVLPIVVALMVACSGSSDVATSPAAPATAAPATTAVPADFEAQAADFVNLADMTPVRGFFISNPLGHLDQALAVANSTSKGGTYPVGTIVQLIPGEAMVKRQAGFAPTVGDWEFFQLKTTAAGTEIQKRGGAEVVNFTNKSCSDCHKKADPKFDFICETDHGCDPLPVTSAQFKVIQAGDPRPK